MTEDDRFYFQQLLSGRDFALDDGLAHQMVNFSYLIGDRVTKECLIVDPAYDVDGLLAVAELDGMAVTGALVTHYHSDHCGGTMMGFTIEGIAALIERVDVPIHVQQAEAEFVTKVTEVGGASLVAHAAGDVVTGTRPGASASWSTAAWWPATRCSSRAAGGPTFPVVTPPRCTSR